MTTYPDPANRYCCSSCREPIPDVDTISIEEAERRQRVYIQSRQIYRIEYRKSILGETK